MCRIRRESNMTRVYREVLQVLELEYFYRLQFMMRASDTYRADTKTQGVYILLPELRRLIRLRA